MKEPVQRLERLKDADPTPGSVEAEGLALLRAREPHRPSPAQKVRVRAALEARGATGMWRGRPALVAASFVAILLVGGVASSSSLGRRWVASHYRRLQAWQRGEGPREAPVRAPVAPAISPAPPQLAEAPVEPPAEAPALPAPPLRPAHAHHAEARAPRPAMDPVITDEPTLVAAAMHALRRDHDPAGAGRLLDDYLRRWPNGALIEEALALAVEAASARGDARARAFAADYLRRFPSGRFGDVARRTLAHAAP